MKSVVGFIGKLVDDVVRKTSIRTFPNQKPWVNKPISNSMRLHRSDGVHYLVLINCIMEL